MKFGSVCSGIEAASVALEKTDAEPGSKAWEREAEAITAIKEALAQPEQESEFFTHSVEQPYDWSEWVCPDPKNYLMKCCECGLVHEAQFGVVRYKSETEREDCDMVDDPNLQAVFRMRRSEQWSPEDTAHRVGGLPMAQPEQEPVAWMHVQGDYKEPSFRQLDDFEIKRGWEQYPLYTTPPQRKPLTDEEIDAIAKQHIAEGTRSFEVFARAIEAAHGIKENT